VFGRHRNDACATPTIDSRKNNGVYRSMDGGATWQKITQSLANGFNTAIPAMSAASRCRSRRAIRTHLHSDRALRHESGSRSDQILRTSASSTRSTRLPIRSSGKAENSTTNYLGSNTGSQGWYDIAGAVDPTNENRIIVGGPRQLSLHQSRFDAVHQIRVERV